MPGGHNRLRFVFPTAREMTVEETAATRDVLAQTLQIQSARSKNKDDKIRNIEDSSLDGFDPKALSPHIFFFIPSAPPGAETFLRHFIGRFLEVEIAAANEKKMGRKEGKPRATAIITGILGAASNFLRRWRNSLHGTDAKMWYEILKKGDPIAPPGERDETLQKLSWVIVNCMDAKQIRETDENIIIRFASNSLQASPGKNGDIISDITFKEKLRRARYQILHEREGEVQSLEERNKKLAALFKNVQPFIPTPREVSPLPSRNSLLDWNEGEKEEMQHRDFCGGEIQYVLQSGNMFIGYSKDVGFSHALIATEVMPWLLQHNIEEAGISLYTFNSRGEPVLKTAQQMVIDYGRVCTKVKGSFLGRSYYDFTTDTLTLVTNPLRQVPAHNHEDVESFLTEFCSKPSDVIRLKTWLSVFTRLDVPNNILFLYGPKNTGKTLFTTAIARAWNKNRGVKPEEYFSNFQSSLLECPLIVADEGLPQKLASSQTIRSMVTDSVQYINRKGLPILAVDGHLRMIITSNSDSDLQFADDNLNKHKIEATEVRFLRIEVSEKATTFLAEQGGREWGKQLIAGDKFIEYVQWLSENWVPNPLLSGQDDRFLAVNDPNDLMDDQSSNRYLEPLRKLIYYCVTNVSPLAKNVWTPVNNANNVMAWYVNEKTRQLHIAVNAQLPEVAQLWRTVMDGHAVSNSKPSSRQTSTALQCLSSENISIRLGKEINRARFWPIKTPALRKWIIASGLDGEVFERILQEKASQLNAVVDIPETKETNPNFN